MANTPRKPSNRQTVNLQPSQTELGVDSVDRLTVTGGYWKNASSGPLQVGALVYVRYQDHVLFRNVDPETAKPIIQEAWGRLEYEDQEYIRLIVAHYQEPNNDGKQAVKATGLVILKKTILEMRRIA